MFSGGYSPAQDIPTEIFNLIFLLACPKTHIGHPRDMLLPALQISAVCRKWRDIALHTPKLWSAFECGPYLFNETPEGAYIEHLAINLIQLYTLRSGSAGLSIQLKRNGYRVAGANGISDTLLRYADRWIDMNALFVDIWGPFQLYGLHFPSLETLSVTVRYVKNNVLDLTSAPALRSLVLDFRVGFSSLRLPPSLESLCIVTNWLPPRELDLTSCLRVRHLRLVGMHWDSVRIAWDQLVELQYNLVGQAIAEGTQLLSMCLNLVAFQLSTMPRRLTYGKWLMSATSMEYSPGRHMRLADWGALQSIPSEPLPPIITHIDIGIDNSILPWSPTLFQFLISPSPYLLESLILRFVAIAPDELLSCLRVLPMLRTLKIYEVLDSNRVYFDGNYPDESDSNGGYHHGFPYYGTPSRRVSIGQALPVFSNVVVRALTRTRDVHHTTARYDPPIVPMLKDLTLEGVLNFNDDLFVGMVESRLSPKALVWDRSEGDRSACHQEVGFLESLNLRQLCYAMEEGARARLQSFAMEDRLRFRLVESPLLDEGSFFLA